MAEREDFMRLTTEIVSAHLANNRVPADHLPALIQRVFNTLSTVEQTTAAPPKPEAAVPVNRSVRPDHIVCLECGKHFSMLKRHLMTDHKLTPEQYRQRWVLPFSYPIVAPDYAKLRASLAKKIGLGRTGQAARKTGRKASRKRATRG